MPPRRRIVLPERTIDVPQDIPASLQKKKTVKNIDSVIEEVKKLYEKYKDRYRCIDDKDELVDYIDHIIENKRAGLDTETTGLNIFSDQVIGFSLHTEGQQACYVPMRHLSRFTGRVDEHQLPVEFCVQQLNRLKDLGSALTLDYFNAPFDMNMLHYDLGVNLWDIPANDGMLMMRMLNTERHKRNNLKDLHADFCSLTTRGPRFNELFPKGSFNVCPYRFGGVYAARDAEMATELVDYAYSQLWLPENEGILNVWETIEKPLIPVLLRMREKGVFVDQALRSELIIKYRRLKDEAEQDFIHEYEPFIPKINQYRVTHGRQKGHHIDIPVKVGSDEQIKVLFWEIMNLPHQPGAKADKDAILATNSKIGEALIRYRQATKMLSTYLEGLDKFLQPDGCVHGGIKQLGADTGRTSAYDPNMQNIPSHNREIRPIYRARPGRYLISCDYSAQEPRITASLARDPGMIKAYQEGKDLYCMIAAVAFNTTYEECLEKKDGELYLPGKERRSSAKTIVLGICYGRQIKSIAEQLKCSEQEAQNIYDKVTKSFPGLLRAQDESAEQAHELGYVTTLWGRRRHLSVMKHDDYEFEYVEGANPEFDPFDPESSSFGTEVSDRKKKEFTDKLNSCSRRRDKEEFIEELKAQGITVSDYSFQRQDTGRKCLNARIQGSAADMSKRAMIAIDSDERLKAIDTYLLLMIHDEVICECPREHAEEAIRYIKEDMEQAAADLPVPFKADAETADCWYGKEIEIDDEGEIVEE